MAAVEVVLLVPVAHSPHPLMSAPLAISMAKELLISTMFDVLMPHLDRGVAHCTAAAALAVVQYTLLPMTDLSIAVLFIIATPCSTVLEHVLQYTVLKPTIGSHSR